MDWHFAICHAHLLDGAFYFSEATFSFFCSLIMNKATISQQEDLYLRKSILKKML